MIKGIGTDIVNINRIRRLYTRFGKAFQAKLLTDAEQALGGRKIDPGAFLAKRWAAKEALLKALGTGMRAGMAWRQIEILPDASGAPKVTATGVVAERLSVLGVAQIHLSLADEADYAVAFVVLT